MTDLHDAFAALREAPAPTIDPRAVGRAQARRRSRRLGASATAVAAVTAVALGGLAALPGRHAKDASLAGVLHGAAAAAAEQAPLGPTDGYRYLRTVEVGTLTVARDGRQATATTRRVTEDWENAQLQGREHQGAGEVVSCTGDAELCDEARAMAASRIREATISAEVAHGAFGPVLALADIPDDAQELHAALENLIRTGSHWRPGLPTEAMVRRELVFHAQRLITTAAAPPKLRAAAFLMLGTLPGVTALGEQRTADGRTGQAIEIAIPEDLPWVHATTVRLVFDPKTSELLESSGASSGDSSTRTVEASGQVAELGQRP